MSSSGDDIPLAQRNHYLFNKSKAVVKSSDDDSPLPSWLEDRKSPAKAGEPIVLDSDSDSDLKEILSPLQPSPSKPSKPAAAAAAPSDTAKGKSKKTATSAKKKAKGAGASTAAAGPSWQHETQVEDDASGGTQTQTQTQTQPSQTGVKGKAAAGRGRAALAVPSSSIPIMLPDRLTQTKVLLELESTEDVHGATDLSGDSGAIGRLMVSGEAGERRLQVDLKGVLYNATIVPCPMSVAVVAITQAEAKVEALFSEFVQLRPDAHFAEMMASDAVPEMVADDDDDEGYGWGELDADGAAGVGGKKKKAVKAVKSKAAPGVRGGVKKKPAARGQGKGKAKRNK